jgi:hypothetical protein
LLLQSDEPVVDFTLIGRANETNWSDEDRQKLAQRGDRLGFIIYALLAIINSPKVVARREHAPSKVLERKLKVGRGKGFQLQPWHEIVLDVDPGPKGDEAGHTGRLTGARALHFVRSFLRIRRGRLEHVRAHWRGDAAAGISRATYRVTGRTGPPDLVTGA